MVLWVVGIYILEVVCSMRTYVTPSEESEFSVFSMSTSVTPRLL